MHLPLPRFALGALVLLGALGWGARAGASESLSQSLQRAIKATESATAVHYQGVITERSKPKAPVQRIALDVSASTSGTSEGTIGIGKGTATVRELGGTIYFDADQAFWSAEGGKSAAKIFAGKWVNTATTSQTGVSLSEFLDSKSFLAVIFGANLKHSTLSDAGTAKIDGQPARVISTTYKKNDAHGRLYVATRGQPYVLKFAVTSNSGTATLTFSQYDQLAHPLPPASSINLDTAP